MSRKDIKKDILDGAIESAELTDEINAKINSLIDKSISNIERAIEEVYTKYKERYGLTDEEAIKYMKAKLTRTDIKKYADMGLLAQADAVSAGNKITRLIMLRKYIITTLRTTEKESAFYLGELLTNVGNIASSHVKYSVGKEIGYIINWDKMPKRQMDKLLKTDWLGGNYKSRLKENYEKLITHIDETLKDGILRGKGVNYMSKQLEDAHDIAKNVSTRLVRTEASRFYNEAEMQDYKDLGIKKWMWMSSLDSRTCTCGRGAEKSCAELDGQIFEVGDKNAPQIPKHPNCRCTSVAYMSDEDKSRLQRRYKVYNQEDRELQAKIDKIKAKKKAKRTPEEQAFIDRKYKIGHYEVSDKYLTYREYLELMQQ